MILTIIEPGHQQWWIMALGAIFIGFGVLITVAFDGEDDGVVVLFGILAAIIWAAVWGLCMGQTDTQNWRHAREEALERAGYSEVELDNMTFTAVQDGDRVKGLLLPLDNSNNLQYQLVEIPILTAN